jgi:hypothetical protein
VDGGVIKFSTDKTFIRNRVIRAGILERYCPAIVSSTEHMYKYQEAPGTILSKIITLPLFEKLLEYCSVFWAGAALPTYQMETFQDASLRFYREKTYERVDLFYRTFNKADGSEPLNDRPMPTLSSLLDRVSWEGLAEGKPGRFHGDLHFENILYSREEDRFVFLDWRQEFGGLMEFGDIYYDLAKLLHGLIISHELIARDLFSVHVSGHDVHYEFLRKQVLIDCEHLFVEFMKSKGYSVERTYLLTALIFLNIAALHHYPYCLLLYYLGKDMLASVLSNPIMRLSQWS